MLIYLLEPQVDKGKPLIADFWARPFNPRRRDEFNAQVRRNFGALAAPTIIPCPYGGSLFTFAFSAHED